MDESYTGLLEEYDIGSASKSPVDTKRTSFTLMKDSELIANGQHVLGNRSHFRADLRDPVARCKWIHKAKLSRHRRTSKIHSAPETSAQ